jgi:chorismate synthase
MSNSFGTIFRITTWGESHGKAIGCVVDGCPAGLELDVSDIQKKLDLRRPGKDRYVTERLEEDLVEILSGVFEGVTTGCPISLLIHNKDVKSSSYEQNKLVLRPSHAQFSYVQKYGVFDHRGGGRASARETACRVAAGAIAEKILSQFGIRIISYLQAVGDAKVDIQIEDLLAKEEVILKSPLFCPDLNQEKQFQKILDETRANKDSIGGVVSCAIFGAPSGLGDPVYDKLDAKLAYAMMGLPASKGFEIGEGCAASAMTGSKHNDSFEVHSGKIRPSSNHAGGILGGISTAEPICMNIYFKPASTIAKEQNSVDLFGQSCVWHIQDTKRHDVCVAVRAVPVCQAMCALVLVDAYLLQATRKMETLYQGNVKVIS